jgi:hypothetical protein
VPSRIKSLQRSKKIAAIFQRISRLALKNRGIAGKIAGKNPNCRDMRANNRCYSIASPPHRQEAAEIAGPRAETGAAWRRQKRKKSLQSSLRSLKRCRNVRKCRENVERPPSQLEELDWLAGAGGRFE